MASWMVHLRIADKLMDLISNLSYTEFVIGNIAPDSGVPNEDWSIFTPSTEISHFKTIDTDGLKEILLENYVNEYFSTHRRKQYNKKQRSFYLGYLTHLITDLMWVSQIVRPSKDRFKSLYEEDITKWIWTLKRDWYDLDFLFIKKNPEFRAFSIYKNAVGFENEYMNIFHKKAFDNRREYITNFYSADKDDLEREYTYLTENEMDRFVKESAEELLQILEEEYLDS